MAGARGVDLPVDVVPRTGRQGVAQGDVGVRYRAVVGDGNGVAGRLSGKDRGLVGGLDDRDLRWRGDRHRLGGGAAGDRVVVGVTVEGGDPVVGAHPRGRVAVGAGRGRAAAAQADGLGVAGASSVLRFCTVAEL